MGAIAYNGVGSLVIIDGIMDSLKYTRILAENLDVCISKLGNNERFLSQQDNDPKHKSKLTTKFFSENKIEVIE
jgi:hypothetical protein